MRLRVLFLALFLLQTPSLAQGDFSDDLDGFTEESPIESELDFSDDLDVFTHTSEQTPPQTQEDKLTLTGNLAFKSAYGYLSHSVDGVEYGGFNQAQSSLYLQLDYKLESGWRVRVSGDGFYDALYDLSHKNYNADIRNTYRTQLRFDDTYIQGRVSQNLDVKFGRQIVVWGKSDSIRVTDVINPLDNRLPGLTDIKDLRLSTTMLKLDYYFGEWSFSAMAIPESRIFLEAAPRGEFFPVDAVFANAPTPFLDLQEPKSSFKNMQYAFALNGVFSGYDLSFYAADVFDSRWHLEGALPNATRDVSKIQMLGSALNIVYGSWLIKSEIAHINGLKYNSTQDEKSRLDVLLGVDYMGFKETVLSFEVANRHIFDYESQMAKRHQGMVPDFTQEDEVQTAIRATRSFLNDSINTTLLLNLLGHNWQYGGFFRASLEYEVANATTASVGVIDFIDTSRVDEKPLIHAISNNDRVYMQIKYSF